MYQPRYFIFVHKEMWRHIVALHFSCNAPKIKQQKENTDKPVTKVFYFISARPERRVETKRRM